MINDDSTFKTEPISFGAEPGEPLSEIPNHQRYYAYEPRETA